MSPGLLRADLLFPDWPAPEQVRSCVTTRVGGISTDPFAALNLGNHVGDQPPAVAENRRRLCAELRCTPAWLQQVHGIQVVQAEPLRTVEADASWTSTPGIASVVLTADCLPVLFCDRAGTRVAAAHAGWRGLANGVLEETVRTLGLPGEQLLVWLGPAIGPQSFEVGPEVREAFVSRHAQTVEAFVAGRNPGRLMADIYQLARIRLAACGVSAVYGGGECTLTDPRFFSYRREPRTGRFASLIWLVN